MHTVQIHLIHPAEAGDLNISFELLFATRKLYVSGHGLLFKTLSIQSPLKTLQVFNGNFRTFCIFYTCNGH